MGLFDHFPYTNVHELNLDWILEHFKEFLASLSELEEWKSQHEEEYNVLKRFMDDIEAGNLPETVYLQLKNWFYNNAFDLVGEMVKHIYFGLNDSGYFIVTIPEQWSDLIFKTTGYDYNNILQPEFGHLCILY